MYVAPIYHIGIYNPDSPGNIFRRRNVSEEEFNTVYSYIANRSVTNFSAILYPVRTNNLKNFALDLFLPATIQVASRVDNMKLKIFAVIASLLLDTLTLPIRLVTAVPRVIYNSSQPDSPITSYLKEHGAPQQVFYSGRVRVGLEKDYYSDQAGFRRQRNHQYIFFKTNLIAHPWYKGWNEERN